MAANGIYSLLELQNLIRAHPEQWRPLVFTNGCFDLLHVGHVRYLQAAKAFGKTLVVGVNSDRSVARLKPPQPGRPARPIVPEAQRAEMIAALGCVDAATIFSEPTASNAISALAPDIYVKGGDYTVDRLPEAATVRAGGGRIELVAIEVPTSTSAIVERIARALAAACDPP
ncbi:cytidyltransferase-related domain protein [Rubidibacter lacunae KORDI 51-2]|uniref:Cytidyltransferase-related domain protein n=1 Tax=Rubidibacter lacunae KORDI 51-2 TaxID=582515 RepID=U5DQ98_9CHRO|nr:adenylyltransferase/cytidyltransferase family protein [Rubidibacter lacunae]ERN42789.1 cytidyltransferase-related domain protein [Rubidibacter lacunae KORDI 51-2]